MATFHDVTQADVIAIARLARLHLEPDEVARLAGELSAILDQMEQLSAVDTAGVEPMTHAVPMRLRLRDDEVAPSLPVEEAIGQAPAHADDLFVVPRIIAHPASRAGTASPPRASHPLSRAGTASPPRAPPEAETDREHVDEEEELP